MVVSQNGLFPSTSQRSGRLVDRLSASEADGVFALDGLERHQPVLKQFFSLGIPEPDFSARRHVRFPVFPP